MTALNKQAHKTENERMAQSLAERNGEPVEGLRQRISELEEIATDYGMKFQKAQDALKHQALLHKSQMEAAEKRIAELEAREVNLPAACADDEYFIDGVFQALRYERDVERAIRAAGIGVKGE
ncbi:ead/Ea22-like family protein [Citrobacter sp. Cf124]|nr:ead/Ea22-like family protein [Citrobacter sp. Cf124]MDM3147120.1 ead/Ea22-like family protein [Citrobacter sp. Cf124]